MGKKRKSESDFPTLTKEMWQKAEKRQKRKCFSMDCTLTGKI